MIYNSTGRMKQCAKWKSTFPTSLHEFTSALKSVFYRCVFCSSFGWGQQSQRVRPGAFTGPNSRVDRRSTRRSGRSAEATGRDFSALRGVCCGQDWWKASASLGQAWRWVERLGVEKGGGLWCLWCLWWVGSWRMKDWMKLNYVKVRLDDM